MSGIATYNSGSLANVFQGMTSAPALGRVQVDDIFTFGTTAVTTTPWIVRDETANAATFAQTTATEAGKIGIFSITPHASGGGRLCQRTGNTFLSADDPTFCEWWVKFVTGGTYFAGLATVTANQSAILSTGALAVQGCGVIVQTDDKLDLISNGDNASTPTANTAVTDAKTMTAGTWYRLGIKAWTTKMEAYVDGRLVGKQAFTYAINSALSPTCATSTAAAKIMTIDLCAFGY